MEPCGCDSADHGGKHLRANCPKKANPEKAEAPPAGAQTVNFAEVLAKMIERQEILQRRTLILR